MTDPASAPANLSLQRKYAARVAAVQCIYSRLIDPTAKPITLIDWHREQTGAEALLPITPDKKLFSALVVGVTEATIALQEQLAAVLQERWTGKRMSPLMRAIFMSALYEIIYTPALRTRIIIDQYVGVADAFLDESDIGFVNGALQELARATRSDDA
jgi:transcription antitermination protein NusB